MADDNCFIELFLISRKGKTPRLRLLFTPWELRQSRPLAHLVAAGRAQEVIISCLTAQEVKDLFNRVQQDGKLRHIWARMLFDAYQFGGINALKRRHTQKA